MFLLYTLVLLLLGVAMFLVRRRAASLERKYFHTASEADRLLHNSVARPGNASRSDPFQSAKRAYELGRVVQKRDRLEAKFDYWQRLSKRCGNLLAALRAWKGRKLPYTLGVVDVMGLMYLVDELTVGQYVSVKPLLEMVSSLFTK